MGDLWVTYGRLMGDLWATYGLDTAKVGETREVCRQIKRRMFFCAYKKCIVPLRVIRYVLLWK